MVGLYGEPPRHAVVLSVDETRRIQALDRTLAPGTPGQNAAIARRTRALKRSRSAAVATFMW